MTDKNTDETKGRLKEAAGAITDDEEMKREGKADQASASVKDKVEGAVDKVKDKLTGRKDDR